MITVEDIEDILLRDLKPFGLKVYKKDAIPEGRVLEDRIVVLPDKTVMGTYWDKNFVEVNFCVPDIDVSGVLMAGKERLKELSRLASAFFDEATPSEYDGTIYRYSKYSIGTEKDPELGCHCVNVKLLFEILNVR